MPRRTTSLIVIAAAFIALPFAELASARAQDEEAESAQVSRARALFEEASQHHRDGRHALAADAFEEAYDLLAAEQHPGAALILYNLGASLAEIPGRECDAKAAYTRFLQEADASNPSVRENLRTVQQRIRELDARVGDCRESSAESPAGAANEPSGGLSPVGPVLIGVGGAAVIAGVVVGALALMTDSDLSTRCGGDTCADTPEHRSMYDDLTLYAGMADGLLIGGAAIAALGVVLTLVLEGDGDSPTVSAGCDGDQCAAVVRGTF